ncbi:hypothetical protein ACFWEJ_19625 [Promicromonospora sp. NPDC060204]|uniref:hypothetical protein n=1 Tax=Promicromonospora sp. NPDC060204 TaxID=3347071 RepID=UPI003656362E
MINVQVRRGSGEIIRRGDCRLDWLTTIQEIDEGEFPFLAGLLPYADTMFNSRQASWLRREVSDPLVRQIVGRESAAEIEELCQQVESGSHLYLWFVGD